MKKLLVIILLGLFPTYSMAGDCFDTTQSFDCGIYRSSEWKDCRGHWTSFERQWDCERDAESEFWWNVIGWTVAGTVVTVGTIWLYNNLKEEEDTWTPPRRPANFGFDRLEFNASIIKKEVGISASFSW